MLPPATQVDVSLWSRLSARASKDSCERNCVRESCTNRPFPKDFWALKTRYLALEFVNLTITRLFVPERFGPRRWILSMSQELSCKLSSLALSSNFCSTFSLASQVSSGRPEISSIIQRRYCSRSSRARVRVDTKVAFTV
ncbi:hypothetical protein DPMN_050859 [Dreissena polymorpha]|uniref:Uncharacterized protein n=1 Tax=Dreissena polymorpha TaxID=45954 RepID=A0A9D4CIP7_DREPO|nr:hypothetical protein DPMN_050859 [Dreissena polymorpha]